MMASLRRERRTGGLDGGPNRADLNVDERPYPERLNYQGFDLVEQLDLFTALRRHGTRILRLQQPEAWLRVGVHSETGIVALRQLVFQAMRHVRHHLPFIAEKRAAMKE
jgi:hypothetical protein